MFHTISSFHLRLAHRKLVKMRYPNFGSEEKAWQQQYTCRQLKFSRANSAAATKDGGANEIPAFPET